MKQGNTKPGIKGESNNITPHDRWKDKMEIGTKYPPGSEKNPPHPHTVICAYEILGQIYRYCEGRSVGNHVITPLLAKVNKNKLHEAFWSSNKIQVQITFKEPLTMTVAFLVVMVGVGIKKLLTIKFVIKQRAHISRVVHTHP